ncbi:hypothetical protein NIES2109_34110 [Nostoc sp. HK-01]|nr:hypothetical protein NIES2109_34110 [Nostoc sp. HK-01]
MKVKKVIEYLQKLDPELEAVIHDLDYGEIYKIANIILSADKTAVRFQFTEDEPA